jgi:tetratricopeptide (TPR) repeat protein
VHSAGTKLRRRSARAIGRRYRRKAKSIGRLYLDLGEALMEAGRDNDADQIYESALREDADQAAWQTDVYASLAETALRSAGTTADRRARRLRIAIEASARAPETIAEIVYGAVELVDGEFLDAHGRWVVDTWAPLVAGLPLNSYEQAGSTILIARCALYTGAFRRALDFLRKAREVAPRELASAGKALRKPLVSDAVKQAGLADTHWVVAQVYATVDNAAEALKEIDAAFAAGFDPTGETILAALRLRAELLGQTGDRAAAAAARITLGRELVLRGRVDEAIHEFEGAVEEEPDSAPSWWQLADARRRAAESDRPPYLDPVRLADARAALDRGLAQRLPSEPDEAWVYCVLALLEEEQCTGDVPPAERRWRGLLAAERALALNDANSDVWALVARYSRLLGLLAGAREACDRATAADADNVLAAQEAVALDIEAAAPDEARKLIEPFHGMLRSADGWMEVVSGYVSLLAEHDHEALERLDEALRWGDDPFRRLMRGLAREICLGPQAGADDFERIRELTNETQASMTERGLALWLRGDVDAAAEIFAEVRDGPGLSGALAGIGAGACVIEAGDIRAAQETFATAVAKVNGAGQAAVLNLILRIIDARTSDPEIRYLTGETRERLQSVAETWGAAPADPAAERLSAADGAPVGSPAWICARVAVARTATSGGQWEAALETYEEVAAAAPAELFPEVHGLRVACLRAISAAAAARGDVDTVRPVQDRLVELGAATQRRHTIEMARAMHAAGRDEDAAAALTALVEADQGTGGVDADTALDVVDLLYGLGLHEMAGNALVDTLHEVTEPRARARVQARLGLLAAMLDDIEDARQWLRHAFAAIASETEGEDVLVLRECERLVDADGRTRLDTALRFLLGDRELPSAQRDALIAARFISSRERRHDRPRVMPIAPVVLSLDSRLLPEGTRSPLSRRLTEQDVPTLRSRLQARTGVALPGVRVQVRWPPTAGSDYALLVRGAVVRVGQLVSDGDDDAAVASTADALRRGLEDVLACHMHEFVGLAEVGCAVDDWVDPTKSVHGRARLDRLLPGRKARVEFAKSIHRLVEESVPVHDLGTLLEAFAEARAGKLDWIRAIDHMRRAIAGTLPTALSDREGLVSREVHSLDPGLEQTVEQGLITARNTSLLALPQAEASKIIGAVISDLAPREPSAAIIVVESDPLRPFVQRLLESHARGVIVISSSERRALAAPTLPNVMVMS